MACEYCAGWELIDADYIESHCDDGFYIIKCKNGNAGITLLNNGKCSSRSMVANFCPMCGERLGDEKRANTLEGLEDAVNSVIEKYPNTLEMLGDE